MELKILLGDNIDLLKQYPDNYFDSVVTDCPYGLGKEPNALKLLQDWIDHGYHEIKGKGFMGESWDAFVPQPLFWKEVFRVLKPGGYVLAFFGTRTYDWGTLAIRLAGFEIRDMICWHYGSGFPKSLYISKQLDKMAGVDRQIIGKIKNNISETNNINSTNSNAYGIYGNDNSLTIPTSDEAKQWDGWGTALKPATEPICVARKPIDGTVAENILKYGTGGINLDGCRIDGISYYRTSDGIRKDGIFKSGLNSPEYIESHPNGRFPANVIFDPFMANQLDDQSGILVSGGGRKGENGKRNYLDNTRSNSLSGARSSTAKIHSDPIRGEFTLGSCINDSGGASRFFYCAKSSQFERNAGCDYLEQKLGGFKNESGRGLSGNPELTYTERYMGNHHPTVKPISLMSYLQRLVTPPGGKTLDPFAGSGTSGCSAYFENIREIVLMEMDETYLPIIEARTKYWSIERNRINYLDEIRIKKDEPIENQMKLF